MPNLNLSVFIMLVLVFISGCKNPSGGSIISNNHTPLLQPPASFNFVQVRAANGEVDLKWKAATRASNYKVYMGSSATTATTPVNNCTGLITSCFVTGLNPLTTYYFNVVATNAAGSKTISSIASALSVGNFDLTSSTVGDGYINFSWGSSTGATSYNLLYGTSPGSYTRQVTNITSPYTLNGVNNGVRYYYKVVAVNAFNGYKESDTEGDGKPFGPPNTPTGLFLTASPGQIKLNWNGVDGADSYKIYRRESSGSLTLLTDNIFANTYTDTTTSDNVTYFYAIKGYNGYDSAMTTEVAAMSISPFTLTSAAPGPAAMQVTVSWGAASGATGYDIRYGTNPSSLTSMISNVTSPYVISNLTGGVNWYFKVDAKNAVGTGTSLASSNQLSAMPVPSLAAPTNLTASALPGQVTLNWTAVSGATSYEVHRGTSPGALSPIQSNITGTTFINSSLTNGTQYYYAVKAYNGYYSLKSNEVTIRPIESFAIASVTPLSSNALTVNWPSVAGADAYDVRYGTASGNYTSTISNVTSPYTMTGLNPATTYYIVVRAKNAIGSSTSFQSPQSSGITKTLAPVNLTSVNSSGQVVLNWSNTAGATSYTVYRGTTSGSLTSIATNITTNTYTNAGLTNGTIYYYAVSASNGAESLKSTELAARTISPFSLTGTTSPNPTSIEVSWPSATGATTYEIRYGTSPGNYTTTLTNRTSPSMITGLSAGTTYYIKVVARNSSGSGTSQSSNELSQGTPVGPPVGIVASVQNGQIVLTWSPMTGASSYKVYRGTTSGTYTELAPIVTTTSYTDTSVVDGTTYYYVLKSYNGNDSANSAEASGKSISAFNITSITPASPNGLVVTFPSTAGGDLYDVRYGTTTGNYTTTLSGVSSPYTITGLAANTNYFVVVRARNTQGAGANRATSEIAIRTPVAAPASFIATATTGNVNLSWATVSGATNYRIFRGTSSGSYTLLRSDITTTNFADATAVNGTTYYYVVRSFNGSESANSLEVSAQPIESFTIAGSTILSSSAIQVTWNAVTGATAYDVRYGTTSGSYTATASNVTSPYTITGLAANTNYFIVVRAKNTVGTGSSVNSSEISKRTATAAPSGLTASASSGQVGLNWTATSGASYYKIYRGFASGVYSELAPNVSGTSYLDTTITNGTEYYYVVKAFNGTDSASSNEVSIRPVGSFLLTAATPLSSTSVSLTWDTAPGADSYDVRYGTTTGVYLTTVTGVTSPYTLTGLTNNTLYYVSIRAKNSFGATAFQDSLERNFRTATAAPASLAATATTGQIALTWTAVAGATNYRVYRGTAAGTYDQSSTVTSTNFTDTTISNGTSYFYVVRAYNGTESPDSNEVTAQSIAGFSIASTSASGPSSIVVTWNATMGATDYDVRFRTASGSFTTVSGVTSPYTITGLTGNTNYFIEVRARNSIGSGSSTQTPEVNQITPLSAPTGLVATATPGQVSLSWGPVSGATNYKIYRGTSSGIHSEINDNVTTNSYLDSSVSNGTTYFYVVRAYNGADSPVSNEVTIRPISSFAISSATVLTSTNIELSWSAAAGANSYDIHYGSTSGSYPTTLSSQTSPANIGGLEAGSTYYFIVVAKNAIGSGTTVTTPEIGATTAFGAPSGLAGAAVPGQVNLTWNAISGATSYKVYRGTTSGSYTEINGNVPFNSYSDPNVTDGLTYFYVVTAYNGTDSAYSNEISIRPISAFTLSSVTPASSSSLVITWGNATGAASYDLRYGTSSGSYTTTVSGVTSPYTLTGLSAGTNYYVSIRARNAIGAGSRYDSNEVSARTSPGIPSSLTAAATTGQIALNWAVGTGATNYNIYRGTATGSYSLIETGVTGTTYTDTGITNGTQYFYMVRANNGTESQNSNEATAQSIAAFSISSVSAPTSSTIQVSWPLASGASTYDISYGTSSGSYTTTLTGVTSPYTITGLSSGTTYYLVVRAKNTTGSGSTTSTSQVSQVTPLGAPTGLAAASVPGRVTLSWNPVVGASSYKIYRGTTSGTYTLLASPVTGTSYIDDDIVNGTNYYYVMKSFNGADSADSAEVSARPIENFAIASTSSPTSSTVEVTWATPAGGVTYDIKFGTATGSYSTTVTGVNSPYTISGLSAGTRYYIVVIAKNSVGSGTSVQSSESSQLTALGAPANLTVTASPSQAGLNWDAMPGATNFKVYRGTTSGSYTLIDSGVTTNAYMDTTVINGTTYFYVVKAFNGSDSANSAEVSIHPISSFSLSDARGSSATSIDLTWGNATGASSYDVRYGTTSGVYLGTVTGVTSPYTLTGLSSGTRYFISIRANNSIGSGAQYNSNEMNAITAVGAPTGLVASATSGSVDLSWSVVSGAASYKVFRGTTSGSYTEIANSLTSANYTDSPVTNGTAYFYVVRAYNGTDSANSAEVTVKPISTFSLTAANTVSASSADLTWGAAAGADSYDVRYGTASRSYSGTVSNVTSTYTLTGLTPATLYYVAIKAKNTNGAGTEILSNERSFTTATAAPVTLAATATTSRVNLTWASTPGATSYRIYRGTTSGSYSLLESDITATNYADLSVSNGVTYYYVVRSFNGSESGNSNEAQALPIGSFSITSTSAPVSTSVIVNWAAASGASTYDVRYGTSSGSYSTTFSNVTSPYTITGLTANSGYYIVVTARNAVGGGASATTSEVMQMTPVAGPSGLTATAGSGTINLTWNAVSGATSYKVYRGTTSGVYTEIASAVTQTNYPDSGLSNGTTYYYAVKAFNGADSGYSSEVFKQPIAAFSISSVFGNTSTSIEVTWTAPTGSTVYDIKYGSVSGTYTSTISGVTSPYVISGLTSGQTYYVQVVAKNTIGGGSAVNSSESNGAPNSPPVMSTISAQTTESDVAVSASFTLNDNNNLLSCTTSMSGSSSNTTVLPNANITFSGSVPNCTMTLTPAATQVGSATVTVTATDGVTPVTQTFTFTVNPCTVASIVWETQPVGMVAGNVFGTAPRVSLRRANNSLCTSNTALVSLSVATDPSVQGDATVTGTASVTPSGGYALFSAASMQRAAVGFTLVASQNGVFSAPSSAFNVTAGALDKFIWETQPATSPISSSMVPAPIAQAADFYGNYISQNGISVTISLQDNLEGATLSGTLTRNTDNFGQATFTGISLNRIGTYFLRASPAGHTPIDSALFDVISIISQNTTASVDMLTGPINHTSGVVTYRRSMMTWGSSYFDGTGSSVWKIVATNTSGADASITLNSSNKTAATITVPAGTTTPTLFTSGAISISGGKTAYNLWLEVSGSNTTVFSSRIVAKQIAAGRTQAFIPLTSIEAANLNGHVETTSTSLTVPNELNFPTYNWVKASFARLDSVTLLLGYIGSGASNCAALFDRLTNTQIGSELCGTSTTENFATLTINPAIIPDTAELEVRVRTSNSAMPARIYRAGLIIRLVNITNMTAIQQVANASAALTSSTSFLGNRGSSYINDYGVASTGGGVVEYMSCRVKANIAGAATFTHMNHGINTSGTSGATAVTGSVINFSSPSVFTTIEAGPISTVNATNQFLGYTHSSGSYSLSNCIVETQAIY